MVFYFSLYLYPLAVLVIANRQLALVLYGHEGIHGTLLPNKKLNDWCARYILLFPHWVSLSRYRMKHFMHHRFVGTKLDADLGLYAGYPYDRPTWIRLAAHWASGKMAWDFMDYYTDLPRLLKREPCLQKPGSVFGATDWPAFVIFQAVVLSSVIYLDVWREYLLFWTVPSLIFLPYNYFIGGLQHGVIVHDESESLRSRTIPGPKWLMEILLPADINFHAVHHLYPQIPHYHLRRVDAELYAAGGPSTIRESYSHTLRTLWKGE